jgi:hypothetical protein
VAKGVKRQIRHLAATWARHSTPLAWQPSSVEMSRNAFPQFVASVMLVPALVLVSPVAQSGVFAFAELLGEPATITHPSGYTGAAGQLEVTVCIDPASESKSELAVAIHNSIHRWNQLEPMHGNAKLPPESGVPANRVDAESVLLHEMGHCLGLAHPNLGSESGLHGDHRRFAKALPGGGANGGYTLDTGADGIIATQADHRGGDVNLNWFRKSNNDPFSIASTVDASTYSNDLADLPAGHDFAAVAGSQVSQNRGLPRSEAVMHQGIHYGEKRAGLGHDDVAMIRLAMSGTDRTAGTETDYRLKLVYVGVQSSCDIRVRMSGSSFAFCSIAGGEIAPNHWAVTGAQIRLGSSSLINWHFNEERLGDSMFRDGFANGN